MNTKRPADYRQFYQKLYRLFDGVTPLKTDCGVLCEKACCSGDETTGMLLFPHEETTLRVISAEGRRIAVCGGSCDRAARPLSCRIFPLFPVPDENGGIRVAVDLRGAGICPLARHGEDVIFYRKFLRRLKKAGKLLAADPECRAFLTETGRELAELAELKARMETKNGGAQTEK